MLVVTTILLGTSLSAAIQTGRATYRAAFFSNKLWLSILGRSEVNFFPRFISEYVKNYHFSKKLTNLRVQQKLVEL